MRRGADDADGADGAPPEAAPEQPGSTASNAKITIPAANFIFFLFFKRITSSDKERGSPPVSCTQTDLGPAETRPGCGVGPHNFPFL